MSRSSSAGYRAIAASGLAGNVYRCTATAKDARRIARRFLKHEDMILRGRRILADQMEFLLASVPRNSRLHG